jgi:hypothetical protein
MITIDQIIITIGLIAILIASINAALWVRALIQFYRKGDTGSDLPPTDLDGKDAAGSAFGKKGGSDE